MKILFINISDTRGGAAISMWRIGNELSRQFNTTNLFLVRSKYSDSKNVIVTKGNRILNIIFNAFGLQYKFLPRSRRIIKLAKKFNPDVISLNQIEGGYFQTRDMIKLCRIAPVFWTIHDCWAFNNNAHRSPDIKSIYPQIGIRWGNWLKHQKHKIYSKSDFTMIFPSAWLSAKNTISDKNSLIIPHGVDIEKFHP